MSRPIYRAAKIIALLSTGYRCTTEEILQHLADADASLRTLSLRTVQRDLADIMEAGIPIVTTQHGTARRYHLARAASLPSMSASMQSPLLAMHMLKAALPQFTALDVGDAIAELVTRLDAAAPEEVISNDLVASINVGEYRGVPMLRRESLDAIIRAIVDKQWLRVTYRQSDNVFQAFPYRIIPYLGRLYLAAWNARHEQFFSMALDRVVDVEAISSTDVAPPFSVDAFMANRFGMWSDPRVHDVVVHVSAEAYADIATRMWHPTQQLTDLGDGRLEIRMRTGISHELVSWVLHWTPYIEVVEPEVLRDEVEARKNFVRH